MNSAEVQLISAEEVCWASTAHPEPVYVGLIGHRARQPVVGGERRFDVTT